MYVPNVPGNYTVTCAKMSLDSDETNVEVWGGEDEPDADEHDDAGEGSDDNYLHCLEMLLYYHPIHLLR